MASYARQQRTRRNKGKARAPTPSASSNCVVLAQIGRRTCGAGYAPSPLRMGKHWLGRQRGDGDAVGSCCSGGFPTKGSSWARTVSSSLLRFCAMARQCRIWAIARVIAPFLVGKCVGWHWTANRLAAGVEGSRSLETSSASRDSLDAYLELCRLAVAEYCAQCKRFLFRFFFSTGEEILHLPSPPHLPRRLSLSLAHTLAYRFQLMISLQRMGVVGLQTAPVLTQYERNLGCLKSLSRQK